MVLLKSFSLVSKHITAQQKVVLVFKDLLLIADSGNSPSIVLLDLSAVFDTGWVPFHQHQLLLHVESLKDLSSAHCSFLSTCSYELQFSKNKLSHFTLCQ